MTRPRWVLALTCLASFMVGLDALVVTTALPAIGADLRAGLDARQGVVTAYLLAYAVGIVPAAALGDRYGRRRVFTLGLTVFAAASAGCALATGPAALLAWRAVQGLGAAAVMPLSLTILSAAYPAARRGAVLGLWGGAGGLAVASGPLVGAALTDAAGWHAIFWLTVPVGLVCAALSAARLPESRAAVRRADGVGLALLAASVMALAWGLARAGSATGPDAAGAAALAVGIVLAAGFAARQRRSPAPLLPPRLLRAPRFAAAAGTAVLLTATINAATFFVAQFFQEAQGEPPLAAGLRLLPWTLTPLAVSPLAGALSDRVGRRSVLVAGMLAQGLGLGWFALAATPDAGYPALAGPLLLAGIGISAALPSSATAALGAVPPADLGTASGAVSTAQRLGAGLGVALTAAVFAAHGSLGSAEGYAAGFRPALAVAAGLSLLGAITALAVAPVHRPAPAPVGTRVPAPA